MCKNLRHAVSSMHARAIYPIMNIHIVSIALLGMSGQILQLSDQKHNWSDIMTDRVAILSIITVQQLAMYVYNSAIASVCTYTQG